MYGVGVSCDVDIFKTTARAQSSSTAVYGVTHARLLSPTQLRMGTAGMKEDKERREEDKKKRVKMERSKVGTKEKEVSTA